MNIKKLLYSLLYSFSITLLLSLILFIIFKNIVFITGLFTDNEIATIVVTQLDEIGFKLPFLLIFCFFILYFILFYLFSKHKVILIIVSIFVSICFLIVNFLLSSVDSDFVFQIINNLKENYDAFKNL